MTDARDIPVDPTSAERLAAQGLTYRTIDTASEVDVAAFMRADARGFLDPEPTEETMRAEGPHLAARRNIGVFEERAAAGDPPVATINGWTTPMSVPGSTVEMWAISSVTVAATHRRRGIARALLEGELRAAAAHGVPLAGLTVSEATIYGRYGFASAVPVARIAVDTRRAGWASPMPEGRLEYLEGETLQRMLGSVHEKARQRRAGTIAGWDWRWTRAAGLVPGDSSGASVRGVAFRDADDAVRGVMAYRLAEIRGAFRFRLEVRNLVAETDEAERALWGFAVQHDLVDEVSADLRPVDDPLPWLVRDRRGVTVTVHDHGWLRILDVTAALQARTYRALLDVVLDVSDPLGFAAGRWRLAVEGGRASVSDAGDAAADASLNVAELSALYAGGVSAATLRAAGLIDANAETTAALDDAFRTVEAPVLDIWY